jgi:alcohol dehydrogenase class IV
VAATWSHRFAGTERVHVGAGSVAALPDECDARGMGRVVVVTGRSLDEGTDVVRRVEALLGARHVATFAGIREHVPGGAVTQLTELLRSKRADGAVAVGGGSPIDGTKAALYHLDEGRTPQIAVPTTLSAAEFTPTAGVTDEATQRKGGVLHPRLTPRCAILDPELTLPTPQRLWLSTGIRALDHALETVYAPEADRFATELSLTAIAMLRTALPACRSDPTGLRAREQAQVAAWYSGIGLAAVSVTPSHPLGRVLGASFGIGHGITSCVLLPSAVDWQAERHPERVAPLARAFDVAAAGDVGAAVRAFVRSLGLPVTLREAGLTEASLAEFIGMIPEEWAPIARAAFEG